MTWSKKNSLYYAIALGLFVLFKFLFTLSDNESLSFLLKPTNGFVSLLLGSDSVYLPEKGYYFADLNIVIDKSCSGFNFALLCFLVLTFLFLNYVDKAIYKFLTLPFSLLLGYLMTLFVNTSRIMASVLIQGQTSTFSENTQHLIHESIGIVTNLSFLVLLYFLTEKLLIKLQKNAQLTQA